MRTFSFRPSLAFATIVLCAIPMIVSCSSPKPKSGSINTEASVVAGNGTVKWMDVEGGFFAIQGDNNITYDPVSLPESVKKDGTPVAYKVKLIPDRVSTHMVGPVVEVVEIHPR